MPTTAKPKKPVDRPFAAKHLAAAKKALDAYEIILSHENGEWIATWMEHDSVIGAGATPQAAVEECRGCMEALLAYMAEEGQKFPPCAKEEVRTEQVNVRLSLREKAILDRLSKNRGFRGVADFLRSLALSESSLLPA